MARNLASAMLTSLVSNAIIPAFLAQITFRSTTEYVWSGNGDIVYNGNTYRGVGSLGKVSMMTEGTDVHAYGLQISLSGIDASLLSESMTDVQIGAPATVWFVLLDASGNILGSPYALFTGVVDKPTVTPGIDTITISLALETRLANLQRGSVRRYTAADQQVYYPGDTGFNWVEQLNDQALRWVP